MVTGNRVMASTRAREALPSPIRKLTPLADRARAEGVSIYHLNIGQPDIRMPEALMEGITAYSRSSDGRAGLLPYAPSQGIRETVEAWQAYYAQLGVALERDQLLVTTGGSEALLFAMMAVADPGDEIIVFQPTYANYFGFARMTSIDIVPVTLHSDDGYHLPADNVIEAQITPRTRALLIATPGNPTGTVFSYEELERLATIAERHGLFLISDETYREIVFDAPPDMSVLKSLTPAGRLETASDRMIVVDSVSKRFSATGARIGCLASRHEGVMEGVLRFAQARLSAPTVEQYAIIPLLRNPRPYTDALTEVYRRRRDVIYAALREIPGVRVRKPEGAFYVFATLPIDDGERFASWLLTDFRLAGSAGSGANGETVMVSPGDGFYVTPDQREGETTRPGVHEVRFAYVLEEAALLRSMTILREALRVYPGAIKLQAQ
jgi:aspartate aminotransferase